MKKVLITGATGVTGRILSGYLLTNNIKVRALVRPGKRDWFEHTSQIKMAGAERAEGDVTDADSIRRAAEGVDVIYHLAAAYRQAGLADSMYRAVNVEGTRNVLEAARINGVRRVVHCSTGGVHGDIANPPANEDAPFNPGDTYQRTKLEGEALARQYGLENRLDVVIVRPIGIYGPPDERFLKMFRGIKRGFFPILGSGKVFYHLTYLSDLAEGFRLCGIVPAAAGRTYLLAGPQYTTLQDLLRLVAKEFRVAPPRIHWPVWPVYAAGYACEVVCKPFGIEPPLYRRRVDFYTKSRAFDATRARTELGWVPEVGLEEGIHRTADWYRDQAML